MLAVLLLLLATDAPVAARTAAPSAEDMRVLDVARATMKAAQNCFLITVDESGQPQARLMAPFDPEDSMKVWLATNRTTRKVGQLRKNPRATLAYHDAAGSGYVTLVGSARLVEALAERKRHWKPEWSAFYPDGPESRDYVLIELTPTRIEVMSVTRQVAHEPQGWRPAILLPSAGGWHLEKHELR